MADQTITFPDIGLHLGVMEALLSQGALPESAIVNALRPITDKLPPEDGPNFDLTAERERVIAALVQLARFPLNLDDVQRIRRLDFDGGNEIYMLIERLMNVDSGGESTYYDVHRLDGLEALGSLEEFWVDGYAGALDASELEAHLDPAKRR